MITLHPTILKSILWCIFLKKFRPIFRISILYSYHKSGLGSLKYNLQIGCFQKIFCCNFENIFRLYFDSCGKRKVRRNKINIMVLKAVISRVEHFFFCGYGDIS